MAVTNSAVSYLRGGSSSYIFGHGLKEESQNGKTLVTVETVDNFDSDKTLPMSASGVETIVGNIDALLSAI